MKRLKVSDLVPDMVIADNVSSVTGDLLVPKGAKLTEKAIELLKSRKILLVMIEGEEEDIRKHFKPEEVSEVDNKIKSRFTAASLQIPMTQIIIRHCIDRLLRQRMPKAIPPAADPKAAATPAEKSAEKHAEKQAEAVQEKTAEDAPAPASTSAQT